ncbi:hypothetical protein BX666DRAFT_2118225 [Dichotomocladium elegans]|nr:hypothetical protein BX666DRAFT_2118225 [Dichotomocladium elegans]
MTQTSSTKVNVPKIEASHAFYKAVKKSITPRARRRQAGIYFSYAKVETNTISREDQNKSDQPRTRPPQSSFKKRFLAGCASTFLVVLLLLTRTYPSLYTQNWTDPYTHVFSEKTRLLRESALEQVRLKYHDLSKDHNIDDCLKRYMESATQQISQIKFWINAVVDNLALEHDDDPYEITEIELDE